MSAGDYASCKSEPMAWGAPCSLTPGPARARGCMSPFKGTEMTTDLIADDHFIMRDGLRFLREAEKDLPVVGEAGMALKS